MAAAFVWIVSSLAANIAIFTRYEIIHQTLCMFYKSLDKAAKSKLFVVDRKQLELLMKEESGKTVYHSTKDELRGNTPNYRYFLSTTLLELLEYLQTELYQLLQRVFNEQYKVTEDEQIELRPKEEIFLIKPFSPRHDPE